MKNRNTLRAKQLLDTLALIDEKYITDFAEGLERKRKRRMMKQLRLAAGIAACLCVAVTGTLFGVHYYRQTLPQPPVVEGTDHEGTQAFPDYYVDGDFVIQDGKLLAYTGDDAEVYIPETVTEITADAFKDNESADGIIAVHISSSVKHIDETAFDGLDYIQTLEIDENNENYIFCDGVLMTSDLSLSIAVTKDTAEDFGRLIAAICEIAAVEEDRDLFGGNVKIRYGEAEIWVRYDEEDFDPDASGDMIGLYLVSITARGQTYTFDETVPRALGGSYNMNVNQGKCLMIDTEGAFVYSAYNPAAHWSDAFYDYGIAKDRDGMGADLLLGQGFTLFFTEDGIYEVSDHYDLTEDYSDCIEQFEDEAGFGVWVEDQYPDVTLTFAEDSEGRLIYFSNPEKYGDFLVFGGTYNQPLYRCVSRDEFFMESGYVTFEGGKTVFNREKTYTVADLYDLDEEYRKKAEQYGSQGYSSADDWLAGNRADRELAKQVDVNENVSQRLLFGERTFADPDGNITVEITEDEKENRASLSAAISGIAGIEEDEDLFGGDIKIRYGEAEICVRHDEEDFKPNTGDTVAVRLISASARGQTYYFDEDSGGRLIYGENSSIPIMFETEEAFVVCWPVGGSAEWPEKLAGAMSGLSFGQGAYIFTGSGVYSITNDTAEDPSSGLTDKGYHTLFAKDEAGRIIYYRYSAKYKIFSDTPVRQYLFCTDRNEYCGDIGYVSFENGGIKLVSETVYTVSGLYDLDKDFAEGKAGSLPAGSDPLYSFDTLDELIEENRKTYKTAEYADAAESTKCERIP